MRFLFASSRRPFAFKGGVSDAPVHLRVQSLIDCASLVVRQITSARSGSVSLPLTSTNTPLHQAPQGRGGKRMISCIFSGGIPAVAHAHRLAVTLMRFALFWHAISCVSTRGVFWVFFGGGMSHLSKVHLNGACGGKKWLVAFTSTDKKIICMRCWQICPWC